MKKSNMSLSARRNQARTMSRLYPLLAITVLLCASKVQAGASDLESAVATLKARTAAILPSGWTVSQTNNTLIVQRTAPVRLVNMINAGPPAASGGDYLLAHSALTTCWFSLRLDGHFSPGDKAEIRKQNEAVSEKLAALRNNMRHIAHKFDDYAPSNPEEKKLVAEFAALKAAYRVIPEYHFESFAVYLTEFLPTPNFGVSFYSDQDRQEYGRVHTAVLANLQAYEQNTPQPEQRTGGGSGDAINRKPSAADFRR
jgi:hypothetical protein